MIPHRMLNRLELILPLVAILTAKAAPIQRPIPQPLADHPGNIHLAGEPVSIVVPPALRASVSRWRLLDEADTEHSTGERTGDTDRINLGTLPVGWYRLEWLDAQGQLLDWTSAAVLAPLRVPTPLDSPIGVDAAISWFAHNDPPNQRRFANLAALAGVNWIRDRLRWREIEPAPGRFASHTTYDDAAAIQHEAGLQVLQVFHDTPPWAREGRSGSEFATDLRHVFRLGQAMARRFAGRVQAWEPWNEANIANFGGHTVDQMCSWQKAAWLGFKAGDSNVIVGWNVVTTVPTTQHADGLQANEAWPYYDTYNIHSYDWADGFEELWAPARVAAAGRPIWVTECDRGQKHLNNAPWFDLSRHDERLKAEYLPQCYTRSLFAGASVHFHFILGHYVEANGAQFGLLRKDFTPRPAYMALAALGRFLAGARCLGKWRPGQDIEGVAFRARPGGIERDVLVVWTERAVDWLQRGKARAPWPEGVKLRVQAAFDYLGRPLPAETPRELKSAPVYLLLPRGEASELPLVPPPALGAPRPGRPCPIVLQAVFPPEARVKVIDRPWSQAYAYQFTPGAPQTFQLRAYNFGSEEVRGAVKLQAETLPAGWRVTPREWSVRLAPGEMTQVKASFATANRPGGTVARDGWCRWQGHFSGQGRTALAIRLRTPQEN